MSETLNIDAYSPQSGRFIAENGSTENLADRLGQISAQLSTMGGSGSYNDLTDKPSINGVTLAGSKTAEDLGIINALVSTTYANLVTLRNGSNLVAGQFYRITDYTTTTVQSDTQSANNAFDIIVRADSNSKLNENAYAIQHEGDTYFNGQNLGAWELKYCLDNDITRFAWADSTNGKGVIYRMKDEYGNECGYDFKNIQMKFYKITAVDKISIDFVNTYSGSRYAGVNNGSLVPSGCTISTSDTEWRYTFDLYTSNSHKDYSLNKYSSNGKYCYDNKINALYGDSQAQNQSKQYINIISFRNIQTDVNCYGNEIGDRCYNNSFGNNCGSNSFGNNCYSNSFGNNCGYNSFGNYCYSNSFGNYCYSNSFGNGCYYNTINNNVSYRQFDEGTVLVTVAGYILNCDYGYDDWEYDEEDEDIITGIVDAYVRVSEWNDGQGGEFSGTAKITLWNRNTDEKVVLLNESFETENGSWESDTASGSFANPDGNNVYCVYEITSTDGTIKWSDSDSY